MCRLEWCRVIVLNVDTQRFMFLAKHMVLGRFNLFIDYTECIECFGLVRLEKLSGE